MKHTSDRRPCPAQLSQLRLPHCTFYLSFHCPARCSPPAAHAGKQSLGMITCFEFHLSWMWGWESWRHLGMRNTKLEAADANTCLVCPRKRRSTWLKRIRKDEVGMRVQGHRSKLGLCGHSENAVCSLEMSK